MSDYRSHTDQEFERMWAEAGEERKRADAAVSRANRGQKAFDALILDRDRWKERAEIAEHDLVTSRRATDAAHVHRHELMAEVARLDSRTVNTMGWFRTHDHAGCEGCAAASERAEEAIAVLALDAVQFADWDANRRVCALCCRNPHLPDCRLAKCLGEK